MKVSLKFLFARKAQRDTTEVASSSPKQEQKLELTDLDACVGGRPEVDGVGCYSRATGNSVF